jgi:hypothetical protein
MLPHGRGRPAGNDLGQFQRFLPVVGSSPSNAP